MSGFMIAAPGSFSGKTMITCGLLRLFKRKGMHPVSFKCGPDYIDPMFHEKVLGVSSGNLDSCFAPAETIRYLYGERTKDGFPAVVEGVMGYYDGLSNGSSLASSYEIADLLGIPVILVVSCKGMGTSAAAVVKGFKEFKASSGIEGVILNRISDRAWVSVKAAVEETCRIPVLGHIPENSDLFVDSRHLGLVRPGEADFSETKMDQIADLLEKNLDIEQLLKIAEQSKKIAGKDPLKNHKETYGQGIRIAVARDDAFCFWYPDNERFLKKLGVELAFFSPLFDTKLPEGISGLILPGGYPEIYAEKLSENSQMLAAVKCAVNGGLPTIAECGGFLYLHRKLQGEREKSYPMAGVISADAYRTKQLQRFGYITLTAQKEQMLFSEGEKIHAHEFHYWDSTDSGKDCAALKCADEKQSWNCIYGTDSLYAGFPHLYFYGCPDTALRYLHRCMEYEKMQEGQEWKKE